MGYGELAARRGRVRRHHAGGGPVRRLGNLAQADVDRVEALFRRANLPTLAPKLGVEAYMNYMGVDKKVEKARQDALRAVPSTGRLCHGGCAGQCAVDRR